MKENALSSIIIQLNELVLKCGALMCDNESMEDVKKIYGFNLLKIPSTKYESGFYYAVRYKDEGEKWIPTKKSTNTDDETLAKAFAIENRERIIKEYYIHKEKIHKKKDGKDFYKMLKEYYQKDSKYLQDDYVNNKRIIDKKQRDLNNSFIDNYLIPYFKEKKIASIQEITKSVYTGLKLYLQNVKNKKGEKLATKTINNYLIAFNRILQYHERNEIIQLPYSKGTGTIKISKEEKANSKKPQILPIDMLKGIFEVFNKTTDKRENVLLYYSLALVGLNTGMRDSEIGRIKITDIKYVKKENYFYLRAYNNKTDYYNRTEADEYRKIPLHSFVVEALKAYIKEKNIDKETYIFGIPKINEDTKKIDGYLHPSKTHKAILYLYNQLKFREVLDKVNIGEESKEVEKLYDDNIEKEMKEKRIVFYSLRHTFNTMCMLYRHNDSDLTRSDSIIDYFMGHKMPSKMMENYTHINKVDDKTFYNNYGKFVIDMLNKFIFRSKEYNEKLEKYIDNFLEKTKMEHKDLFTNENINVEDAINIFINPLLDSLRDKKSTIENEEDDDDIFPTE